MRLRIAGIQVLSKYNFICFEKAPVSLHFGKVQRRQPKLLKSVEVIHTLKDLEFLD